MRLFEIMNLAKDYIVLGLVGLLLAAGLYFIGYSVIYKRRMKDEETIRLALKKYGVTVPDNAEFTPEGKGQYTFDVRDVRKNSGMIDETLTCNYSANGNMKEIRNNIVDYRPVRQVNIILEQEAYERIKQGKFSSYADKINEIIINDVTLGYSLDSKGFYQPVYEFDAQVDGNKVVIAIPALKS